MPKLALRFATTSNKLLLIADKEFPKYTDPTLVFPGTKIADFKNIPFLTCFHDFWGQKQSFFSNLVQQQKPCLEKPKLF